MLASVLELDARAGDEIPDGLGDEHLPGIGRSRDAGGDVYGDPTEFVADPLALAGVDARPDLKTELRDSVLDRASASDSTSGAIERGHESVAGGVDFNAAEALELTPD
jgi:hypothetical protein